MGLAVKKALALALVMSACAPTYTAITHRCPNTTMLLGDFGLFTIGLADATLKYNTGHHSQSMIIVGVSMGLAVADNLSETRCRK